MNRMYRKVMILIGVAVSIFICNTAAIAADKVVVVPLFSTTTLPPEASQTLVSASGEWSSAGLVISPSMIVKDLFFYVASDTTPPCGFSMSFVTGQFTSRTIQRYSLGVTESVHLQFGAGVNTSDLRFGTIGGGTCVRYWTAFGIQIPK